MTITISERIRYAGIYPVLYAFWNEDGSLDHGAMRAQVEHVIANGAHGVTILGIVTEVKKMSTEERRETMTLVGRCVDGRVPYAVTIAETSPVGQIDFAHEARDAGADWVILQPPADVARDALIAAFGEIADKSPLPVAIQNNPTNLPVWLEPQELVTLHKNHQNVQLLKAEGNSVDIACAIEGAGGALDVFGGHGGLEFPALMRSGGAGLIPAPDALAVQVCMFHLMRDGSPEAWQEAERLHQTILPEIVFMSRAVPGMLCYGKRLYAEQVGLRVIDRQPALTPTRFGLAEMVRALDCIRRAEAMIADRVASKIQSAPATHG